MKGPNPSLASAESGFDGNDINDDFSSQPLCLADLSDLSVEDDKLYSSYSILDDLGVPEASKVDSQKKNCKGNASGTMIIAGDDVKFCCGYQNERHDNDERDNVVPVNVGYKRRKALMPNDQRWHFNFVSWNCTSMIMVLVASERITQKKCSIGLSLNVFNTKWGAMIRHNSACFNP